MSNILVSLIALLSFLGFVMFILVLVKLFKNKGILHGILGIITCGIYPFIWGWVRHRHYELTRYMTIWTLAIVLQFVLQGALFYVGFPLHDFAKFMPESTPSLTSGVIQKMGKKPPMKTTRESAQQKTMQKPTAKPGSGTERTPVSETVSPAGGAPIDYTLEMKKIESLLQTNDKRPDLYYNRGWLHSYKGNLQMAIEDYSKAIELDKSDGDAYFNRGLILAKMGKYEEALRDFSDVIQLQVMTVESYCNRGNIYFETGKMDLALKEYNKALNLDTNDGDLLFNRAQVYKAFGQKDKAMADLKKAAQMKHERTLKEHPELAQ